jgi:hypothetical protein
VIKLGLTSPARKEDDTSKEGFMHHLQLLRTRRLGLGLAAALLGSLALATSAVARPFSTEGSFVIGDQNADVGSVVTFWGAQWWKDNGLSGGLAPASFKGFADTASASCGEPWRTRPGNSSFPPAEVANYIDVAVSSLVTKSGPVISGDTVKVVRVHVKPGYGPNPGHPGTGTVVGVLCDLTGGGLPT